MRFNSTQELYDYIHSGKDLYDIDEGVYLFDYNWIGAIAYYYLDPEEVIELANQSDGYIGEALGPGGYIIDVQLRAPDGEIIDYDDPGFDEHFDDEGYTLDYSDIMDFLEQLVNDRFLSAMPDDLLNEESYDENN